MQRIENMSIQHPVRNTANHRASHVSIVEHVGQGLALRFPSAPSKLIFGALKPWPQAGHRGRLII